MVGLFFLKNHKERKEIIKKIKICMNDYLFNKEIKKLYYIITKEFLFLKNFSNRKEIIFFIYGTYVEFYGNDEKTKKYIINIFYEPGLYKLFGETLYITNNDLKKSLNKLFIYIIYIRNLNNNYFKLI
jgi:hypothetical protein